MANGRDGGCPAEVAGALAQAMMHDMRWAVKERHDLGSVEPLHAGVFMVVQRFRGDLGLYVHLHAARRIDQEGAIPSARIGYDFAKLARLAASFTIDYTHYLDARYNAIAADGTFVRAALSKNYIDYIPFAELQLRPTRCAGPN